MITNHYRIQEQWVMPTTLVKMGNLPTKIHCYRSNLKEGKEKKRIQCTSQGNSVFLMLTFWNPKRKLYCWQNKQRSCHPPYSNKPQKYLHYLRMFWQSCLPSMTIYAWICQETHWLNTPHWDWMQQNIQVGCKKKQNVSETKGQNLASLISLCVIYFFHKWIQWILDLQH